MRRALLALLLVACAGEPPAVEKPKAPPPRPPTAAEARELIAGSGALGEFEFTEAAVSLPMQRADAAAEKLAKAGWITIGGDGAIELTGKAKADKRFLPRPNGILDIVPLAKKEMGDVSAVRGNADGTADADFTWTWKPNEVGQVFAERYAGTQNATATLLHDGTSWSVLSIRRR